MDKRQLLLAHTVFLWDFTDALQNFLLTSWDFLVPKRRKTKDWECTILKKCIMAQSFEHKPWETIWKLAPTKLNWLVLHEIARISSHRLCDGYLLWLRVGPIELFLAGISGTVPPNIQPPFQSGMLHNLFVETFKDLRHFLAKKHPGFAQLQWAGECQWLLPDCERRRP